MIVSLLLKISLFSIFFALFAGTSRAQEFLVELVKRIKPSAVSVGLLGLARLKRGELFETGQTPHYVQRAEAELKRGLVPGKARQIIKGLGKARRRTVKPTGMSAGS